MMKVTTVPEGCRGELHQGTDDVGDDVLADLFRHPRHLLHGDQSDQIKQMFSPHMARMQVR